MQHAVSGHCVLTIYRANGYRHDDVWLDPFPGCSRYSIKAYPHSANMLAFCTLASYRTLQSLSECYPNFLELAACYATVSQVIPMVLKNGTGSVLVI
jgi:hypothetical protein